MLRGSMKRKTVILLFVIVIALGFYPYETKVIPEWRVRFVDGQGVPLGNLSVEQTCYNNTFSETNICAGYPDSRQLTDANGEVAFVAKAFRAGAISRVARFILFRLASFAHGSVGVSASLLVSVPAEYESAGVFSYDSNQSPPAEIVLPKKVN